MTSTLFITGATSGLGEGVPADADSIGRGWQLVQRGVWLWLLILCAWSEFYA